MTTLVIPYKPREVFRPYHASKKRFSLTVAHRRAGKTVARINKVIKAAVICDKPNPRFGYLAPSYVQAKDIAWLYFKEFLGPLIAHGAKVNESELSVTLPHNNAVIRLYGAENAERMRGLYFDGIVIDEAQNIGKSVLTTIILPALSDRQGWLDVSGTPKGWYNMLGELYKTAQRNPDEWYLQNLPVSQTGLIDADELKRQRNLMPENEYQQEFECSFDAAIQGAYYAAMIVEAEREGRVTSVPYNPACEVFTAWDLGYGDTTAIWWAQLVGKEPRIIDYYEKSGVGIDHYVRVVKDKPYNYMKDGHFLPHDAGHGSLRTGTTLGVQLIDLGLDNTILQRGDLEADINAARLFLPTAWFDLAKCEPGLDALRNYQSKWDEKNGVYSPKPLHNWASNGSDAFRYLVQAINTHVSKPMTSLRGPGSYSANMGVY